MTALAKQSNDLQEFVQKYGLDKRSMKWVKLDAASDDNMPFQKLSEEEIRDLTIGVYQLKTAKSYSAEHFTEQGLFEVLVSDGISNIISAKIQSRQISAKKYALWVKYNDVTISAWYCSCKNGARVVGMCGHIACIVWYLSFGRYQRSISGVRDWTDTVEDAAREVDFPDSDSDDDCVSNQEE
ncbi:uncharacterized protein LOC125672361 [Ostrea edulis]|uniref:uncharacterized protein LOC125672361 n=1 Tax=Ostrea edulis TaxID=37623 RepID=UPI0024AF9F13|nr:uncharacterized protein LOC125672361 [Ostrea edulis]